MTHDTLTAFGITKTIDEWVKDPLCKVDARTIRQRRLLRMSPEECLTRPPVERKYKGVQLKANGRWQAQIRIDRNTVKHLGYFDTAHEAARAYDEAARALGRRENA